MERCLLFCLALSMATADWNYTDTTSWGQAYPACNGRSQSPIDLSEATSQLGSLPAITFTGYDQTASLQNYVITNTGHTIQVDVTGSTGANLFTIQGGGLPATYQLKQLHMHWGSKDGQGSEHTINGTAFPLELHFVHFNSDNYSSIDNALNETNGLAVIGVFVQSSYSVTDNAPLGAMATKYGDIKYRGNSTTLSAFKLSDLMPWSQMTQYSRYNGSLTTPACYESVIWTVMKTPITITTKQLIDLREAALYHNNIGDSNPERIENNYRPVLNLNGRQVWRNFAQYELPAKPAPSAGVASFSAINLVVVSALAALVTARFI